MAFDGTRRSDFAVTLSADFQHALECDQGVSSGLGVDLHDVYADTRHDSFHYPQYVCRLDAVHRRARADDRV